MKIVTKTKNCKTFWKFLKPLLKQLEDKNQNRYQKRKKKKKEKKNFSFSLIPSRSRRLDTSITSTSNGKNCWSLLFPRCFVRSAVHCVPKPKTVKPIQNLENCYRNGPKPKTIKPFWSFWNHYQNRFIQRFTSTPSTRVCNLNRCTYSYGAYSNILKFLKEYCFDKKFVEETIGSYFFFFL